MKGKDMSNHPKFLVGEPVERKYDGVIGTVVRVDPYMEGFSYAVDLGREPMEGMKDDVWVGTEEAWRSMRRGHAHVVQNSRDCDGEYEHKHVSRPSALERTEEFGDLNFKERVMGYIISFHVDGILTVAPHGLYWEMNTEEGYTRTSVVWCDEENCDDRATQRDFSAERAGY
jgi:hypothetical protein